MLNHIFSKVSLFLIVAFSLVACTTIETASGVVDTLSDITTATPAPTATPGPIDQAVSDVADTTGLNRVSFLYLSGEDWINLSLSLVFVLLTYFLAKLVVRFAINIFTRHLNSEHKNVLIAAIGAPFTWFLVIFALQFSTLRLVFLSSRAQTLLSNLYFLLNVLLISYIAWKLIDFAEYWYRKEFVEIEGRTELDPIIIMFRRVALIFIALIAFSISLSRLGLNTNALTITLGILGIALTLAAQDTLADAISGFLILADRPFRVGDAVEVEAIDDWGVVKDIGLRTTRILTYDNREVIVPNSIIGKNLVINYTYPDPNYRVETRVRIPYNTNIKTARQILTSTIHKVEGVLPNKSAEVLCHEIGESAIILRVWWWIGNYDDVAFIRDRVIETIRDALLENKIGLAYPVHNLNLRMESDMNYHLSHTLQEAKGKSGEKQP